MIYKKNLKGFVRIMNFKNNKYVGRVVQYLEH